jgi:hypothetical protein
MIHVSRPRQFPALIVLILVLTTAQPLTGIDFPDPFEAVDPGRFPEQESPSSLFLPFSAGELSYNHALLHSDAELFHLGLSAYGTVVRSGRVALGYRIDSLLLAGPVAGSETAASAAEFWLNAVQYEYGLHLSFRLTPEWSILGEYSRLSLHPLRDGYGETAYDILKIGAALPEAHFIGWTMKGILRLGYHSLFPFWESELEPYRVRGSVSPRLRLQSPGSAAFYLEAEPNLLVLSDGSPGWELFAEAGFQGAGSGGGAEFFIWVQFNDESELLEERAAASRQIGAGFRLSTSP